MKVILFVLLIFSQNHFTNCTMFDFMSDKFSELSGYIYGAFKDVSKRVKQFFIKEYIPDLRARPFFIDRPVNHDMKYALSDLTKKENLQSEMMPQDLHNYDLMLNQFPMATPQLAFWHGRIMESHIVKTTDDYFLTVHRLSTNPTIQANRTVLLHHGLLGSSTDWILLGPTKSLPYILSDAGYDVWITNARGNYYSRGHLTKHLQCLDYWKFSWQEMGEFDLPAVIDYIRHSKQKNESINFIGHSMGATALLVLLSSKPKYNEYLRVGILLAPLVFMNNLEGPMKVMATMSEEIIKLMGDGEFLPSRKVPSWLATKYCRGPKIFCTNPLLFLSGLHQDKRWNASFIARLLYHIPAGGSTNTLLHYMQVANSGKFHRYNEPEIEFSLKNVTLPIALFSSSDDWLATLSNVLKLHFDLVNPIDHHIIRNRNMTHTDFVWGTDANYLVFNKVIDYLENGLNWNLIQQNEVK